MALNDQSKDMYEDYQRHSPRTHSTKTLSGLEMHYLMRYQKHSLSKWKEMIESTDFIHSSRKAWKTTNKLTKDYTEPQQQCKDTADQVAHQLLLNGQREQTARFTKREGAKTNCHRVKTNVHHFLRRTFCTVSKP